MKKTEMIVTGLVVLLLVLFIVLARYRSVKKETHQGRPGNAAEEAERKDRRDGLAGSSARGIPRGEDGKPPLGIQEVSATNEVLRKMSGTNALFQKWGRNLMLSNVNYFLERVPVFGLEGPLKDSEILSLNYLTLHGAECWLHTTNRNHRMRYEHGVLWEVIALADDYTGVGRQPRKVETWADSAGKWSQEEAAAEVDAIIRRLGFEKKKLGISGEPRVTAPSIERPPRDGRENRELVTPFYTASFFDKDRELVIEAHFRQSKGGRWLLTYWFNNARNLGDTESTDGRALYERFMAVERP